jgi:hypothetical protein
MKIFTFRLSHERFVSIQEDVAAAVRNTIMPRWTVVRLFNNYLDMIEKSNTRPIESAEIMKSHRDIVAKLGKWYTVLFCCAACSRNGSRITHCLITLSAIVYFFLMMLILTFIVMRFM